MLTDTQAALLLTQSHLTTKFGDYPEDKLFLLAEVGKKKWQAYSKKIQ